jgi:hypothetical protein
MSEISEKKLLSNRINAKKSTGPRTEAGKARASMNAMKYGLDPKKYMINDENPEEFEAYKKGILKTLNPENFILYDIALQIVFSGWNFRRYQFLQSKILNIKNLRLMAIPKQRHITVSWKKYKEESENEANLKDKNGLNDNKSGKKYIFKNHNEPKEEEKIEEGLPNDLWGVGSVFKLSLMEKRALSNFHRLLDAYRETRVHLTLKNDSLNSSVELV